MVGGDYNSFFYSTVCHVCKSCVNLKVCAQCKVISYCSVDHQRIHWPQHRDICKFVKKIRGRKTGKLFSQELTDICNGDWTDVRNNCMLYVELQLGRKLQHYERQMFMFPRVCDICKEETQHMLKDCDKCFSVSYCCEEHKDRAKDDHENLCYSLSTCFRFDMLSLNHSINYPDIDISACGTDSVVPDNIEQFIRNHVRVSNSKFTAADSDTLILASRMLTCPLTLLYSLHCASKYAVVNCLRESMTIHVVGASYLECEFPHMWEVLLHWLAYVKVLYIVYIGPELPVIKDDLIDNLQLCDVCEGSGKKVKFYFQCDVYHNFIKCDFYNVPNIITVFNCGLCETEGSVNDPWLNSIPHLINHKNVVTIITSYTECEAEKDYSRLSTHVQFSDVISVKCQKNPFASKRPYRDWEGNTTSVFYENAYLSVFCL